MTALLRYAMLKSARDRSLWAFLLLPAFMPVAALTGSSLSNGLAAFHYPLVMAQHMSPVQNANLVADISTVICALFAALPAFWTLRNEVASRAITSLTMAARPLAIVATLVLFAAAIGMAAWILSMGLIALLTTALPAKLAVLGLKIFVAGVTASSFGALAVMISPQPAMIIAIYLGSALTVPWYEKAKVTPILILPLVIAVVCTALGGFLLERRCAR